MAATQFTGLPIETLIGAPLKAAGEAQRDLANTTLEFIRQVAYLEPDNVNFSSATQTNSQIQEVTFIITRNNIPLTIQVPLLCIVNIPSLQISNVHIAFNMKVHEMRESTFNANFTASASLNYKVVKARASLSISGSRKRQSDQTAEYSFEVDASQSQPEGLSTILNIMESYITKPEAEVPQGN